MTESTETTQTNDPGKQLSLHEAQVQACMCMNRILYLTQDPEIKAFFLSYIAGFSEFDPGYKEMVQNLLTALGSTVGMQVSITPEVPRATMALRP